MKKFLSFQQECGKKQLVCDNASDIINNILADYEFQSTNFPDGKKTWKDMININLKIYFLVDPDIIIVLIFKMMKNQMIKHYKW